MDIEIKGEYIELNKLLKIANLVPSGGVAGLVISNGEVLVDDEIETRKRCKIFTNQKVFFNDEEITVKTEQ